MCDLGIKLWHGCTGGPALSPELITEMERDVQPGKPYSVKVGPKKDQAWLERKVAELKAELEKLPADRQEQFKRELEKEIEE